MPHEDSKLTRKRIKKCTQNSIDEELSGFKPNKRYGKRKKKVEKPFKIWYRYIGIYRSFFTPDKNWNLYREYEKEHDRNHELKKLKRGRMRNNYELTTKNPEK